MQRPIKFRAWIADQNYMAIQGTPDLETLSNFMFHWGDRELMQYTGLKDKNGVEIYEGDIICNTDSMSKPSYIVYWREESADYWARYIGGDTNASNLYQFNRWCEVIGNIYESPELLEVKK